ncbi:hypothetical protein [Novosphingobium colocasiae]|uniref:Uncharacterized protein n=1 Tax=Novosphingobium colocasiae TaxID=1256513 RepID=A0A918PHK9_9SPHN|nr:hypothetical protein [Novosphingobium colocasiae]GGZ09257.1 hypothetical protein GCM10011614_25030 [Novosphingobium colocasiae]
MTTRTITVAETHAFARSAERIWSESERAELVDHVAHHPEAGDVIPGTGLPDAHIVIERREQV